MSVAVGIDLGTTNSVIAMRDEFGRPAVIPNREGANLTPSVIYFGTDPPTVGQEAKEWARVGHDEIAGFFKPHMGSPLYRVRYHGRDYDAVDLSAMVLRRLKADAESRIGRVVDRAVITVPAYFADPQRKATIEAGRRAGLEVMRILNEPTAAAIAYGLQKTSTRENVLIYDLGGGTFDVTIAEISPDSIQVLSTAGDHDLGGKNWDDRIAELLAERFLRETGFDPLEDPVALNEILLISEQAKWTLSDRSLARVALQFEGMRRSYELSRAEFEAMTAPLMDRTQRLTEEALEAAGLAWGGLSTILLVGGSTRMPMVRSYVKSMSGRDPKAGVNVDEVVALGAAIQASIEEGRSAADALPTFSLGSARKVSDVMSHSLGSVAVSADGSKYVNDIIIRRNSPIPAESTRSYLHELHGGAVDRLEIYLTQGESDVPLDCSILGKYVFSGFHPTDAEVRVEVTMSYDADGVVQVSAIQGDTRHALAMTVEPVGDDLSWLGRPPATRESVAEAVPTRVYLAIDVSSSMAGSPLFAAQQAARAFLDKCDFTRMEVGVISFSDHATLHCDAVDNPRAIQAALLRLEADGTTNLADAIQIARTKLMLMDRRRFIVILTDGFPDAPEAAVEQAREAREEGIDIVAIGMGAADLAYLERISGTQEGSIFAMQTELTSTFSRIAKVISEGGRGLRKLS
ncbi:MAG: Hsp70 family protein [Isosphaeraceae bacterium]|nr:Hsp70 family protein [Isosphaeraceae bacterium]